MRTLLCWLLRAGVSLLIVVAVVLAFVYWRSNDMLAKRTDIDEPALTIAADADSVERGEHIAVTRGCTDCHHDDLAGDIVLDSPVVGRASASNLTHGKGGIGARLDAKSIERAVRHGTGQEGRALFYMPAFDYSNLSDADIADLIAYVSSRPPIDREMPPSTFGPLLRTLLVFGQVPPPDAFRIDHHAKHTASIDSAATVQFGSYIAHSCTGCHGEHFSGGRIPGLPPSFPPARNITPDPATGIGKWTKVDFYTAIRAGKRPDGSALDPFMPWPALAKLSDTEIDALWMFLQSQPPRAAGNR